MNRRHQLLQVHKGDHKEAGQVRGRMTYKETKSLRVICGFFGILSLGMCLDLASDCLCPVPLPTQHPLAGL